MRASTATVQTSSRHRKQRPRLRVVFQLTVGLDARSVAPEVLDPAFAELDAALTRLTGGVLRFVGRGTWTAGSEAGHFGGPVEQDITNTYMLSVLPEHEDSLYERIKATVCATLRTHALPADHIHVARFLTEERIFRVSDEMESRAARVGHDR